MKSYELSPTYENLIETFSKDTISRNSDIFRFVSILDNVSDSCSIALDGSWGSGKTFFVKQSKMVLDAFNDFVTSDITKDRDTIKGIWGQATQKGLSLQPQVSVYYDAWENDNDEEPVLSLIYSILKSVDTDFSFSKGTGCLTKAAALLEFFTGKKWTQIIESFKSTSPLTELEASKNLENLIKEFFDSLLAERGNRLIVFIDELDRCKPVFAVKLLERIKHYFSNDRITFVFSINTNELQHTIKRYYGDEFDACRYLDRFFDLRISLPQANLQRYYQSINFNNSHYTYDIVCDAVIKAYHFELREIAKFIRLSKIAAYAPTHDDRRFDFSFSDGRAIQFGLLYITPIMIGLKISDSTRYEEFINGKDYMPLVEVSDNLRERFFEELLGNNEVYEKPKAEQVVVTIESKLKQVYEAIFVKEYDGRNYCTTVGSYQFSAETKQVLLRTASLLSNYTQFNID